MKYKYDSFCVKLLGNGSYGSAIVKRLQSRLTSCFQQSLEQYLVEIQDRNNGKEALGVIISKCYGNMDKFRRRSVLCHYSKNDVVQTNFFKTNNEDIESIIEYSDFRYELEKYDRKKNIGEFMGEDRNKGTIYINGDVDIVKDSPMHFFLLFLANSYLVDFFEMILDRLGKISKVTGGNIADVIYALDELDFINRDIDRLKLPKNGNSLLVKYDENRVELLNDRLGNLIRNNLISSIQPEFGNLINRDRINIKHLDTVVIEDMKGIKKQGFSYNWLVEEEYLNELFELLRNEYKLIAKETKICEFKSVFSTGKNKSIIPIKWHDDNASELLYLIIRLAEVKCINENEKKDELQAS